MPFLLLLMSISLVTGDPCDSPLCSVVSKLRDDVYLQKHVISMQSTFGEAARLKLEDLDRRLRTVEQPCKLNLIWILDFKTLVSAWMVDGSDRRWLECSHGPCRCRPETYDVTCWHMELTHLPLSQVVPKDVQNM